jgi:LacI family transcriptional regulator
VAMIAGSLSYRAHEDRELGFLAYLAEAAPDVEVLGVREAHDDEGESYRQTRTLLSHHPDLAGIYNIGGGAGGVARALREARRERDVVFVGHGLTPETRAMLIDGTMDAAGRRRRLRQPARRPRGHPRHRRPAHRRDLPGEPSPGRTAVRRAI